MMMSLTLTPKDILSAVVELGEMATNVTFLSSRYRHEKRVMGIQMV